MPPLPPLATGADISADTPLHCTCDYQTASLDAVRWPTPDVDSAAPGPDGALQGAWSGLDVSWFVAVSVQIAAREHRDGNCDRRAMARAGRTGAP